MHTIVELPEFLRSSDKLLSEKAREELIQFLAINPTAGVVLEGTGGIRKLRWQIGNCGKSAGARVIYYYDNSDDPLFLLTAFGKNEKANLSKAERNLLAKLTQQLLQTYKKKDKGDKK